MSKDSELGGGGRGAAGRSGVRQACLGGRGGQGVGGGQVWLVLVGGSEGLFDLCLVIPPE